MIAMKEWLSGSLAYSLLYRLFTPLKDPLSRFADTAVRLNKGSILDKLYKCAVNFLEKEAHIEKSLFYKVMVQFGSLLKRVAVCLNGFFNLQLSGSFFWRITKDIDKEFNGNPCVLTGLVLAGAFAGYSAAAILRGAVGTKSAVIMAVLLTSAVILLLARNNIKNVICGSLSYKLLIMIVKAALP